MKVSTCCGAVARTDGVEEMGICPDCKEHCGFDEVVEDAEEVESK